MAEWVRTVHITLEVETNKRTLTFSQVHDSILSALEAAREWADGLLDY